MTGKSPPRSDSPRPRLKQAMDPALARALAHPLRGHILVALNERPASPAGIARETGVPVTKVSNQMAELERRGLVEMVRTRRRRGVDEHFYGPSRRFWLTDSEWARLPESIRPSLSIGVVRLIVEEISEAVEAGTFDLRNRHLSRTSMWVDEQGWRDLTRVQEEALLALISIREESARRLSEKGERGVPATAAIVGFERPPAAPAREHDG